METPVVAPIEVVEAVEIASFIGSGINGNEEKPQKKDSDSPPISLLLSEVELMETYQQKKDFP